MLSIFPLFKELNYSKHLIVVNESTTHKVLWNKCRDQEVHFVERDSLRMGMAPLKVQQCSVAVKL